jgi:hypothetical protein
LENANGRTDTLKLARQKAGRWCARAWALPTLAVVALTLPSGPAGAAGVLPAVGLVPHVAGYSMQVVPVGNSAGVQGGRGVLQLEWLRDCDGMAYTQHSVLTLNSDEGAAIDSAVHLQSWEAADASRFRFLLESSIEGEVTEEVSGLAERGSDGSLVVRYTLPEPREERMAVGTMFPWQQMRAVMTGAEGGEQQFWHRLLRGEAEGDPIGVSVRILRQEGPPTDLGDRGDLLPVKGWRVVSAFFEDKVAAEPKFEINETIMASGVITRAEIAYPDMIMRLKLERLKRTPVPECGK